MAAWEIECCADCVSPQESLSKCASTAYTAAWEMTVWHVASTVGNPFVNNTQTGVRSGLEENVPQGGETTELRRTGRRWESQ